MRVLGKEKIYKLLIRLQVMCFFCVKSEIKFGFMFLSSFVEGLTFNCCELSPRLCVF